MDQRQHNQEYIGNNPQRVGGNFGFNGGQNDPFNSFASADNENAFDAAHWNQTFPAHQQSVNGFGHGNHVWQQNPYQSSSMLQMPNYGVQPGGGYDQAYSRSPAPFNYPSFDSNPSQVYSPPAFDNAMAYGQMPLNNSTQYDYPGQQNFQQSQETISPQALQNYPIFPQNTAEENRQVRYFSRVDDRLFTRGSTLMKGSPNIRIMTLLCLYGELLLLAQFLHLTKTGLKFRLSLQIQCIKMVCVSSLLRL